MEHVKITAEECTDRQLLFLAVVDEEHWNVKDKAKNGDILKINLRKYGTENLNCGFEYDPEVYREANGSEKIMVVSGKKDVIIWRD